MKTPAGSFAIQPVTNTSVWMVEDNRTYRTTLARVLDGVEELAHSRAFANAEDAIQALKTGRAPDVLLLDVELPGVGGLDALQTIKALAPTTRVVMLTVFDDPQKIFRAVCAGASGYLLKTAPVERIVEAIHEVLAGGAPMHPSVARSVLAMLARQAAPKPDTGLTDREHAVLELMTQGMTKKEMADRLAISYHTVDTHLRNIYTKLHVHNSSGAVAKALADRLV